MSQVREHFNRLAADYDYYKRKNWYYYANLKKIIRSLVKPEGVVLDVGCGTGDILNSLVPNYGLGLDISPEMIKIAKSKYGKKSNLQFISTDVRELKKEALGRRFDYIIMTDVLEHLEDISSSLRKISELAGRETKIIISAANPFWEPFLVILEKIGLKMPEGPHQRISIKETENLLIKNNLKIIQKGHRLLLPYPIPIVSNFINKYFYKVPVLKGLAFVIFWVCGK